jgi:Flp pilus assembly protein TadG
MFEKTIANLTGWPARKAVVMADERGQSLVEFALVLPVVLLLVMGILWFGRAFNYATDQTHLANEAARYASVNGNPGASQTPPLSLSDWVLGQIDTAELKAKSADCAASPPALTCTVPGPAQVTICAVYGTSKVGDPLKVSITSQFRFLPELGLTPDLTIKRTATMRIEVPPPTATPWPAC